jgi:hypothetical protein
MYLKETPMPEIAWLESAARKVIDPRLQVMRPSEIRYDWLEEPVRELIWLLNHSGVVETLGSCGGHPDEEPEWRSRRGNTAFVLLHVLDEAGWRSLALAIAVAIQRLPGATLTVSFDHEAQVQIAASTWLSAGLRRRVLDAALGRAAAAVAGWSVEAAGIAGD